MTDQAHLVLVDEQAKFSQEAVGQAGSTQRGEQFPDRLLSSFPNTPTPREQDGHSGLMENPTQEENEKNEAAVEAAENQPAPSDCWTHLDLLPLSRWAWSRKSRSQSISTVSRAAGSERRKRSRGRFRCLVRRVGWRPGVPEASPHSLRWPGTGTCRW